MHNTTATCGALLFPEKWFLKRGFVDRAKKIVPALLWYVFSTTRKFQYWKLHDWKFQEWKLHEWKISWKKIPWWNISWMKVPWKLFPWPENSMKGKFHEWKLKERKLQESMSSVNENSKSENSMVEVQKGKYKHLQSKTLLIKEREGC